MSTLNSIPLQAFEVDTRCLSVQGQPMPLIDLCLQRGIDSHRLLRGTGLFLDDVLSINPPPICAQQYLQLISNARQLLDADDSGFLYGQRILPGSLGLASQALQHCSNLQHALELLVELRPLLSPLLSPRLRLDKDYAYLHWFDSCEARDNRQFLVEASMTAVVAMSRRLGGEKLPWTLYFRHAQPRHIEQYWVNLGEQLTFSSPMDLMRIPRHYLTRPYQPTANTLHPPAAELPASPLAHIAIQQARRALDTLPARDNLLNTLYEWLCQHAREAPGLERAAEAFGMSPATFKRKLHKQGTSFQKQHDQVRLHLALYLFEVRGYSNEAVARYLHFHDATNFRRSFKRWSGAAPSALLHYLRGWQS